MHNYVYVLSTLDVAHHTRGDGHDATVHNYVLSTLDVAHHTRGGGTKCHSAAKSPA